MFLLLPMIHRSIANSCILPKDLSNRSLCYHSAVDSLFNFSPYLTRLSTIVLEPLSSISADAKSLSSGSILTFLIFSKKLFPQISFDFIGCRFPNQLLRRFLAHQIQLNLRMGS